MKNSNPFSVVFYLLAASAFGRALAAIPTNPCTGIPAVGGKTWVVSKPCLLTCSGDSCTFPPFDKIEIKSAGALYFDQTKAKTVIYVRNFVVDGELHAGSQAVPFTNRLDIVFTGASRDQDDKSKEKIMVGDVPMAKMLLARQGSTISIHGQPKTPWLKLVETAKVGTNQLVINEFPKGWKVGDKLIVPTTGVGLSSVRVKSRNPQNEVVTIKGVSPHKGGTAIIQIAEALKFDHFGASKYINLNGEVGLLSRNIRLMGNNTDALHEQCLAAMAARGPFSSADKLNKIRDFCYGGHTVFLRGSTVNIANAELTRMGQATRIARYPLHWHIAADVTGSSVKNNSVHNSYQRCVTVHGTWNAHVEGTTCYLTHGHSFYLEDAIEFGNMFLRNLAVAVRPGPMVCSDFQIGPAAFWITNPNNSFVDNLAVDVGGHNVGVNGVGYWIISGGSITEEKSPSYTGTNYWTKEYQQKEAGLIFNPSRSAFAYDPTIPKWILNQQQGRTPIREFVGNGARSCHKGYHSDGFITSSVPGEIGHNQHPPEEITVFSTHDGTCNYFPAGDYAIPSGEGLHVYAPVHFNYDQNGKVVPPFTPTWSVFDKFHVSRCDQSSWSRNGRLNITNSVFAYNWMGQTNHIPGEDFCVGDGIKTNPGLATNMINCLFIGHGDEAINAGLCANAQNAKESNEPPAAIRQYDGGFYLWNTRFINYTLVPCADQSGKTKSLPYSLLASRQDDCNGKFPVQLHHTWPLGAHPDDKNGQWQWAMPSGHPIAPTPAPPTPPPTPSPPPPPTPPPTPRPPPGKWNKTSCASQFVGGQDVRERTGVALQGETAGSYDRGIKYCEDCMVRCFVQQKGTCLGVTYDNAQKTCAYFTKIVSGIKASSTTQSAVLAADVPPSIEPEVDWEPKLVEVVDVDVVPSSSSFSSSFTQRAGSPEMQNLISFSGTAACGHCTGGLVDMTGTVEDPLNPGPQVGFYAKINPPVKNVGEMADYTVEQLKTMEYASIRKDGKFKLNAGWFFERIEHPDRYHVCAYCFYDIAGSCHPYNTTTA